MAKAPIFLLSLFIFIYSKSQAIHYDTTGIYKELSSSNADKKINGYVVLSQYLGDVKALPNEADSVANLAVIESKIINNPDLIFSTTLNYLNYALYQNITKAEKYTFSILAQESLTNNQKCNLYIQKCNLYLKYNLIEKANDASQSAFRFVIKSDLDKAKYLMSLYELNSSRNEKLNAFKNLNDAILFSRINDNDSLLFLCYKKMILFYYNIEEWEKAKASIDKCFDVMKNARSHFNFYDTLNLKGDLMLIYSGNNENEMAYKILEELYPICKKYQLDNLKEYLIAILRKSYLNNNRIEELCNFYCTKYPEELSVLEQKSINTYYKVQALIFENKNEIDSAKHYWALAEGLTLANDSYIFIANFYNRKAEFYLRLSNTDSALVAAIHYFEYAKKANYFPFVVEAANQLDSLYAVKGDISSAYQFSKISKEFADSNRLLTEKDKLLSLEIENINQLNAIQAERLAMENAKKENFQVLIIIIVVLLSLAGLFIISKMQLSQSIIKTFGYLTFVFFFEFIIYLLDGYMHHLTHGQPLYIMALKVIIIGILLPIHHATEYRVVHYLTRKNLIKRKGYVSFREQVKSIWRMIMNWLQVHDNHDVASGSTNKNE